MRTILLMIAELYRVEKLARERGLAGEDLRLVREQGARPTLEKLHGYLLEPRGAAAQERCGAGGELHLEELDRAGALLRQSGPGYRQQPNRALFARLGRGP
jgi:hypothetical protein